MQGFCAFDNVLGPTTLATDSRNASSSLWLEELGPASAGWPLKIASIACSTLPFLRRRCFRASMSEQQAISLICATFSISSGVMGVGLNGSEEPTDGVSRVVISDIRRRRAQQPSVTTICPGIVKRNGTVSFKIQDTRRTA